MLPILESHEIETYFWGEIILEWQSLSNTIFVSFVLFLTNVAILYAKLITIRIFMKGVSPRTGGW